MKNCEHYFPTIEFIKDSAEQTGWRKVVHEARLITNMTTTMGVDILRKHQPRVEAMCRPNGAAHSSTKSATLLRLFRAAITIGEGKRVVWLPGVSESNVEVVLLIDCSLVEYLIFVCSGAIALLSDPSHVKTQETHSTRCDRFMGNYYKDPSLQHDNDSGSNCLHLHSCERFGESRSPQGKNGTVQQATS
ncbi:hypothetical protein BT63DRAFT_457438 [Microthyrium microscopicum]|uniref:Uncharacterized protein n=1 Tax=Microthyrium microscopicum TaxID=703497 RepID=A0A6A6U5T2_9PEZI|nr:hypothetical protein BT63DRAFT_457438 [Microthyrium microscopicum]